MRRFPSESYYSLASPLARERLLIAGRLQGSQTPLPLRDARRPRLVFHETRVPKPARHPARLRWRRTTAFAIIGKEHNPTTLGVSVNPQNLYLHRLLDHFLLFLRSVGGLRGRGLRQEDS
jgi:hypothetical protein